MNENNDVEFLLAGIHMAISYIESERYDDARAVLRATLVIARDFPDKDSK